MIDQMSRQPIYQQIIDQLEHFLLVGVMKAGDEMPSVRVLSVELCANPNTVQKAYTDLNTRGILCSVPGKGCFIAENAAEIVRQGKRRRLEETKAQLRELSAAGIPREEMLALVNEIYDTTEKEEPTT